MVHLLAQREPCLVDADFGAKMLPIQVGSAEEVVMSKQSVVDT